MSASGSIDQLDPTMTAPWTRPTPLPDKPGGETNLLHRDAWADPANPLRVELKPWYESDPPLPGVTEQVDVFLDDNEANIIATRTWPLPMRPDDYFIEISADKLPQGEHRISFIMTNYLDVKARSFSYTVTIDKQEPLLATPSKLVFPPEVLPPGNQLTARYLERNGDQVNASLPLYVTPRPWDRITWYWGTTPNTQEQGGVIELDETNFSEPLFITIAGQLIRDRGDGFRYAWYQVQDRASNQSYRSDVVELDVAATPIPRTLPWPTVERAAGTGELQTLDPHQAIAGVVIEVPESAVIYPLEPVRVRWGEPGELGHWIADQPIAPGGRRFSIPMRSVAAFIGKTLWVSYGVTDDAGEEWGSERRKVQVSKLSGLPTVQCNGLSGGSLSLRTVAATGAILRMDKWPLITADQWILITMTGVGSGGQDSVYEAIPKRKLEDHEVNGGIGGQNNVTVGKAFLNTLRRNAPLTGKVYVSFDSGNTWPPIAAPNFPLLQLTLID